MIVGSRHWLLVLLVWVVAITAGPRTASAQTTNTATSGISMATTNPAIRVNDDTNRGASSTDPTFALTITRADCESTKLKYRFSLSVPNYQLNQKLEAWASMSAACNSEYGTTSQNTVQSCWQLSSDIAVTNGVATIEFTPKQLLGIGSPNPGTKRILTDKCSDTVTSGKQNFTVYFMLTYSNKVEGSASQGMSYLLVGPVAPTITGLVSADQALEVKWDKIASSAIEVNYEFFCATNEDPNGCKSSILEGAGAPARSASGGAGGESSTLESVAGSAGTAGDLGYSGTTNDTALGGSSAAGGSAGASGTTPSINADKLLCGRRLGRQNLSGFTDTWLKNNKSYAVAIGVRDTYGNLGKLSTYECAKPLAVTTFFEAYRDGGGEAGGGFCNLGASRNTAVPAALSLLGICAWLRGQRRRNRLGRSLRND